MFCVLKTFAPPLYPEGNLEQLRGNPITRWGLAGYYLLSTSKFRPPSQSRLHSSTTAAMRANRSHTRSRKGCLTCRRRRKKCDERRPNCWNCERNNLECAGYQAPVKWISHAGTAATTPRKRACGPARLISPDIATGYDSDTERQNNPLTTASDFVGVAERTGAHPISSPERRSQRSGGHPEGPVVNCEGRLQSPRQIRTSPSAGSSGLRCSPLPSPQPLVSLHNAPLAPAFPFLIKGIRTAHDKRLLHHFTHTLSPKLVLHPEPAKNPFNQIVLPMALHDEQDWGLFDLMLSFAASHLVRLLLKESGQQHTDVTRHFENIKCTRYGHGIMRHAKNLSSILNHGKKSPGNTEPSDDDTQINYALATTMLLCQWSTCEGGDQSPWRLHLNASRELVRRKIESWRGIFEPLSDADQMLLEWFFFHDVISMVTFPRPSFNIDLQSGTVETVGNSSASDTLPRIFSRRPISEILWIGPNDGLLEILERILALRQSQIPLSVGTRDESSLDTSLQLQSSWAAHTSSYPHGYSSVNRASISTASRSVSNELLKQPGNDFDLEQFFEVLAIEDALREWSFNYINSQQLAVGASYQCAAYIMLYFTLYRTYAFDDSNVRSWVSSLMQHLAAISETDNTQTCALFPLFICGVTVKNPQDRQFVIGKVQAYSRWSGMGYIDDVIGFLVDWWQEQDRLDAALSAHPLPTFGDEYLCQSTPSWWAWESFMRQRELQLILI